MFLSWAFIVVACSIAVRALDGTPTVNPPGLPPLNPPESSIINHHLGARATPPQTNAKRLAAGLPPLPPVRKWPGRDETRPMLPRTSASACTPGAVQVNSGATVLGFLSRQLNEFGEYANTVGDRRDENALKICLSRPSTVNGNSDAKAVNSMIQSLPFFGAFVGPYSSGTAINTNTASYLFLAQIAQTGPGALPTVPPASSAQTQTSFGFATGITESYESSVWRVDGATNELQLWWVNPDRSTVQVPLVHVAPDGLIVGTGNPTLLGQTYERTVTPLTFYYVSD